MEAPPVVTTTPASTGAAAAAAAVITPNPKHPHHQNPKTISIYKIRFEFYI
jgi:hypothetical protein